MARPDPSEKKARFPLRGAAPFVRLWLNLWIAFAAASTFLVLAFFSVYLSVMHLTLRKDFLEEALVDLQQEAPLFEAILAAGTPDERVVEGIQAYFREKNLRELAEAEESSGFKPEWLAVAWTVPVYGLGKYETIESRAPNAARDDFRGALSSALARCAAGGESVSEADGRRLVVAVPLRQPGGGHGAIAYGMSMPRLKFADLPRFYSVFVPETLKLFGLLGLGAGGILAVLIGRKVGKLRKATEGFLAGRFDVGGLKPGGDEIGMLSAAVIRLGAALPSLLDDRRQRGAWEERGRIAAELHDNLKQELFALSLNAEALAAGFPEDDPRGEAASALRAALNETTRSLDRMIKAFGPQDVLDVDLEAVVAAELSKWKAAGSFERYSVEVDSGCGDAAVRQAVALVAREAIANAARHARAREVRVAVRRDADGGTVLTVRDDGKGLDRDWTGGFGTSLMRARARERGGSVSIWNAPEGGAELVARFPGPGTKADGGERG